MSCACSYRDIFIPSWPDDLEQSTINRVVGDGQIVDEIRTTFTHDRPMEWFLPGVPPTHRRVEIEIVAVVRSLATRSPANGSTATRREC